MASEEMVASADPALRLDGSSSYVEWPLPARRRQLSELQWSWCCAQLEDPRAVEWAVLARHPEDGSVAIVAGETHPAESVYGTDRIPPGSDERYTLVRLAYVHTAWRKLGVARMLLRQARERPEAAAAWFRHDGWLSASGRAWALSVGLDGPALTNDVEEQEAEALGRRSLTYRLRFSSLQPLRPLATGAAPCQPPHPSARLTDPPAPAA